MIGVSRQTGTCQPSRSYPLTEEQEALDAFDVALKLYNAGVFTVQLFDNAGDGQVARQRPFTLDHCSRWIKPSPASVWDMIKSRKFRT